MKASSTPSKAGASTKRGNGAIMRPHETREISLDLLSKATCIALPLRRPHMHGTWAEYIWHGSLARRNPRYDVPVKRTVTVTTRIRTEQGEDGLKIQTQFAVRAVTRDRPNEGRNHRSNPRRFESRFLKSAPLSKLEFRSPLIQKKISIHFHR